MIDERDVEAGRRLLRSLLPWARAEAAKQDMSYEARSALGAVAMRYAQPENLDALLIYPAPLGGWHADLLLRHVPPGTPNTFGTPINKPCRTRDEAEECGKAILIAALATAPPPPSEDTGPVFLLYSVTVLIPPTPGVRAEGYGSDEAAIERIETMLDNLFPGGFTPEALAKLSPRRRASLLTVLYLATVTGVYVYPPRRDASPSRNAAPPDTRH